ncbi:phosphoribosylamine--glycine ligase [Candidatus Micrarchaeota archaeon]|nr:phosphoribosylamine--glycine ligase [Candidatus Micrarchaeota archaeon]MBU1681975.1 phosphoribosylamine--glycine ligase [Candidatus Micrarchaeota archaeon]
MKVLLVGNGAREHAIAENLARDCELYCVMSKKNPAMAQLSKDYWICNIEDPVSVESVIKGKDFDLGFSSPDATLAAGVSDVLEEHGMLVASPSKAASRIEWDKSYMRSLHENYHVGGTPKHEIVTNIKDATRVIKDYELVAIKPLGLTGGKGVKVSGDHFVNLDQKLEYTASLLEKDGSALIEEKLIGEEFTLQAFCDGSSIALMPPVQDHKRAFEGDSGPNTGGMGSYTTGTNLPFLNSSDLENAKKIIQDAVYALKKDGHPFKGILYGQFMATKESVKLIEFNARFGDPEAMNVLALLNGSLTDVFLSMAEGQIHPPTFSSDCTVVKYLVPDGYPTEPKKDLPVEINGAEIEKTGASLYYASVYENEGKIFTSSSRSFGILGRAQTLDEAEKVAESACAYISGSLWHRKDIGTSALVERRVAHMRKLRGIE